MWNKFWAHQSVDRKNTLLDIIQTRMLLRNVDKAYKPLTIEYIRIIYFRIRKAKPQRGWAHPAIFTKFWRYCLLLVIQPAKLPAPQKSFGCFYDDLGFLDSLTRKITALSSAIYDQRYGRFSVAQRQLLYQIHFDFYLSLNEVCF